LVKLPGVSLGQGLSLSWTWRRVLHKVDDVIIGFVEVELLAGTSVKDDVGCELGLAPHHAALLLVVGEGCFRKVARLPQVIDVLVVGVVGESSILA